VPELFCVHPLEADISGLLQTGENRLEVTLTISLRNMLGPHHLAMGQTIIVSPVTFSNRDFHGWRTSKKIDWATEENRKKLVSWVDDYYVTNYGLLEAIVIEKETQSEQ
jgi:hypothetical protein